MAQSIPSPRPHSERKGDTQKTITRNEKKERHGRNRPNISRTENCEETPRISPTKTCDGQPVESIDVTAKYYVWKCMYTNANSLMTKIDELRQLTVNNDYYIVGVTESWATVNVADSELKMNHLL